MCRRGYFILILIIVNLVFFSSISTNSAFNRYQLNLTKEELDLEKTNGELFSSLINQIYSYRLTYEDYQELDFYSAFGYLLENTPYWPAGTILTRNDMLSICILQLVTDAEVTFNGTLKIFPDKYFLNKNKILDDNLAFSVVSVINSSSDYFTFDYSEGLTYVGTINKFINATLNTLFCRIINSQLTPGIYSVERNSTAAVTNLRSALNWLSFSFNETLLAEIIHNEIDIMTSYEFPNWYTKASYALLCIDAGKYFANETLTSLGESILDEIWFSTAFQDDDDQKGLKFTLALDLLDYNISYSKSIADFGVSLLFANLSDNFLQPITGSKDAYLALRNGTYDYYVNDFCHYSLFKLLDILDLHYPIAGYSLIQEKIMNFYFTLLYYDELNEVYNPHIEKSFIITPFQLMPYIQTIQFGFLCQFTQILSQFYPQHESYTDTSAPDLTFCYYNSSATTSGEFGVFISDDFEIVDNNTELKIDFEENSFIVIRVNISDTLTGIRCFEIFNSTTKIDVRIEDYSFNQPFYLSKHTTLFKIKTEFDSSWCYYLLPGEILNKRTQITFRAYDKIGNSVNYTVSFEPMHTKRLGFTINQGVASLLLILIPVIIQRKRQKRHE